jgi:imidazole glycerol-phosphate synthase subunit HisH
MPSSAEDIVIIRYNAGNIRSVLYALDRIGVEATVTDDQDKIRNASKVIFPGVGEASTAMNYLKERNLDELIRNLTQPVLGICLGMQLLCRYSEENDTECIGVFDETIKLFRPANGHEKVPQIGWNNIYDLKTDLFENIKEQTYIYSVHSYYAEAGGHTIAKADYILPYSAALKKGNFYGVQFHPEKSAKAGEQILKNFLGDPYNQLSDGDNSGN